MGCFILTAPTESPRAIQPKTRVQTRNFTFSRPPNLFNLRSSSNHNQAHFYALVQIKQIQELYRGGELRRRVSLIGLHASDGINLVF